MKARVSSVWMYTAMTLAVLSMTSCNSQKKKEREAERRTVEQQMPAGAVVETETVVVEVDTLLPTSTAVQNNTGTPERTK